MEVDRWSRREVFIQSSAPLSGQAGHFRTRNSRTTTHNKHNTTQLTHLTVTHTTHLTLDSTTTTTNDLTTRLDNDNSRFGVWVGWECVGLVWVCGFVFSGVVVGRGGAHGVGGEVMREQEAKWCDHHDVELLTYLLTFARPITRMTNHLPCAHSLALCSLFSFCALQLCVYSVSR